MLLCSIEQFKTDEQLKNADIGRPIIPVSEYFLQFRAVQKQES